MSVYVMPRVRAGVADSGKWEVKVQFRWPDGSLFRQRFVVGEGTAYPVRSESAARKFGESKEREAWTKGQPTQVEIVASSETVTKWWGRYLRAAEQGTVGRKNKGRPQTAVGERRGRFAKWIEPEIGAMPMLAVTANDVRKIVEKIDEQIRVRIAFYAEDDEREGSKPGISDKTGSHIWSEITSGFREACGSKLAALRIEGLADPTANVMAPMKAEQRAQAALYPSEAFTLLASEDVPLSRRRVYAVAMYTGMRRSELARLTAEHVDFEHKRIVVVGTKTHAAIRRVPIEPALLPLLRRLTKERPSGPLLDVPAADGKWGYSWLTKRDLGLAEITRADLLRDDAVMMPFTGHGFRHVAITWSWIAGRDETWLRIVYGHTMNAMTRRYLDAEALGRATYGTPFPTLPPSVLGGGEVIRLAARTA